MHVGWHLRSDTYDFKKKSFALLSAIDIDVKFLVLRLKIVLWLVSPKRSGWIILYLESTSKSVCTCYRKHQPQMKHCPEESVSSIMAMGRMPHFPQKNIIGNFKWVFMKRGQSSCSKLRDLQISLGIQYRTLSPWGWDTLVLTLFSIWYIVVTLILVLGSIMGLFTWQNGVFSFANKSPFRLP